MLDTYAGAKALSASVLPRHVVETMDAVNASGNRFIVCDNAWKYAEAGYLWQIDRFVRATIRSLVPQMNGQGNVNLLQCKIILKYLPELKMVF